MANMLIILCTVKVTIVQLSVEVMRCFKIVTRITVPVD